VEIADQITGVVAAVQSHDITRQQLEHVRDALESLHTQMSAGESASDVEKSKLVAGLTIQSYQLRSVREVMLKWVSQISGCLDSILHIGCSELSEIGPMVLKQDEDLSAHLSWIEKLESESQAESEEIQDSLAGMSTLTKLVGEHLERSQSMRDRMLLLNFNSIVEASHLGTRADVILEVSRNIKRISSEWSAMTDLSGKAMEQILRLVSRTTESMEDFSQGSKNGLQQARDEIRRGLAELKEAAICVARNAAGIDESVCRMRGKIASVQVTAGRLNVCLESIGLTLTQIDKVRFQVESESACALPQSEKQNVEDFFSLSYTTEMERRVLRAALNGESLQPSLEGSHGNDVELF
jgi:hypothetical protein